MEGFNLIEWLEKADAGLTVLIDDMKITKTETEEIAGAAARERSNRAGRLSHKTSIKTIVNHFRHTIYRIYTTRYFYNTALYSPTL